MKTINAKRIAAVAASLLMGLAFAGTGGVTWSNIPIINNQGQPAVQIVVGSTAQPSDGVVAANIAAVIGSLEFTSVNVSATPTGLAGVHCVVTTPTCSLTNQQVWFNERGFSAPSGSYAFTALIGSVLNGAVQAGVPASTKTLQGSGAYTYPETSPLAIAISPVSSPFTSGPNVNHPVNPSNGGGLTFSSFTSSGQDNILQIGPTQLPGLTNNWGTSGQTSYLWLTGFPVYDQASGSNPKTPSLAVASYGGAYQIVFNKPIQEPWGPKGNTINNAVLKFLGQNYTILNYTTGFNQKGSANSIAGGTLSLASTLSPIQTVYVGHNVSSGGFTVSLTDLGQPNSGGVSQASVNVYYNGTLTNTTQLNPPSVTKFQVGTHAVYVKVNQTFAGLYAYQKWAKLQLYSNVFNITNGAALNTTNAGGWNAYLYWTNTTSSASTSRANALQSIIVVNNSAGIVVPGGSLVFVTPNMTAWKATFVGDTLGTNYDPVTFTSSLQNGMTYQNTGSNPSTAGLGNINNLTNQPAQLLTVTSQIPSAFTAPGIGASTSSLTYNLAPYLLDVDANTIGLFHASATTPASAPVNIVISSTVGDANVINPATPITVYVSGYATSTATAPTTVSVQVAALNTIKAPNGVAATTLVASNVLSLGANFYNITDVYMSQALPYIVVNVIASQSANVVAGSNVLADYDFISTPQLIYKNSNHVWYQLTSGAQATYNQQNGQTVYQNGFTTSTTAITPSSSSKQYYTYSVNEYDVPSYTSSNDLLIFGIYNSSSAGAQNFQFVLNQSASGTKNNMTYVPSAGASINAPLGFVTERGSKVASVSPGSVTINYAKTVDTLQFLVGPVAGVTASNTVLSSTVGPVGVGQSVPGFSNLTVSKVNATCAFTSTSCQVVGLSNLTASTSSGQSVVPVHQNTATTPLAVLDSNANQASDLIVVGSKYVNSVAGSVFAQNPALNSSFGTSSVVVSAEGTNRILVAGYTANQTVQAGNQFINALLQAAGSA